MEPPLVIKEALDKGDIQTRIKEDDSRFLVNFFIVQARKSLRIAKTLKNALNIS